MDAVQEELERLRARIAELEKDRIENEAHAWESEHQLENALNQISLFAIVLNPEGKIANVNQSFLEFSGWSKEELLERDWKEVFSSEEENEKPIDLHTEEARLLNRFKRKLKIADGNTKSLRLSLLYQNNSYGKIIATTLIGEDITEKKKKLKALKEGEEQLKDLFENANDLIQVFSLEGEIQLVNKAWKDTLQYTDEEINTLNFKDLIHPDHLNDTLDHLNNILQGEKDDKFETVLTSKNGRNINIIASVNVRYEKDTPVLFRGIFHDNTEHLRSERAQKLYYKISTLAINSDNLENLLYNIHMELRSYIAVNNFHVALFDDKDQHLLNFPYYVDENHGSKNTTFSRPISKGLTEYSLFHNEPTFLYEENILELVERKEVELLGPLPKIWLGVPLILENRTLGVIAVKSHSDRNKYKKRHLDLLHFISSQIALVIERKKKEEKIIDQTARLNAIFQSSSHLIWSVNKRRGLTSFNQNYADAVLEKYGEEPELDSGSANLPKVYFLTQSDYHEFINERYKDAFSGIPQHYETRTFGKDGNEIWRETYLNPIFLPDGRIEEVSGISHDITEKKRYDISLQESEQKFRNIFESFQDIYYRTDMHGIITLMSPSGCEISGYSEQEILGKDINEFYVTPGKHVNIIRELILHGSIKNYESNLVLRDGSIIQTVSNLRLIYDSEGKPNGIEGVARDITYLKKASEELIKAKEVAEKSLKVKESFLANMSHEIRTPMNGMIGMIDLLSETYLNEDQQRYVMTIKKSSETLLRILNDILDLSKIEAGKMQLRLTSISLESTIEKLHSLFAQQAQLKGVNFYYSIASNVPKYVLADETRLLQILSNLTSNAIKFTEKGSVSILLTLEEKQGDLNKLKAEISDTGIGISEQNLQKLFNYFSQVDNSSTKTYAGTGLGLAISKELCKMMNGQIGVRTKDGEGSTFWFTFEAKDSHRHSDSKNTLDSKTQITNRLKKLSPKILLVDDNQVNRMVASEILKKSGCQVETASNGLEAIEKVKNMSYELVFMDIQMPQMDGITATKHIKALNLPQVPPIVAMTAYAMEEDRQKFLAEGMDDYIAKPISSETIIAKILEILHVEVSQDDWASYSATPVQQSPEEVIIHIKVVQSMKSFADADTILKIYEEFDVETTEILKEARKMYEVGDFRGLSGQLHTLKGTSGTLGVEKIEKLSRLIEGNLKQNNFESLYDNLVLLENYFAEFRQHYISILNQYNHEESISG